MLSTEVKYYCSGVLEGSKWEDLLTDHPHLPNFTIYTARHPKYIGKVDVDKNSDDGYWVDMWLKGPFTNESVSKALGEWLSTLSGTLDIKVIIEEKGECIATGD